MTVEIDHTISLEQAKQSEVLYGGSRVLVQSAPNGLTVDVKKDLLDPGHFYGETDVHHAVRFRSTFNKLIGKYDGQFGEWTPDDLLKNGIIILEYFNTDAKKLSTAINNLAQRLIDEPGLYDDKSAAWEYYDMARSGYQMLRRCRGSNGLLDQNDPLTLSLERGGLVSARLALGKTKDGTIPGEIRVVTKRTQLEGDAETDLSVTVKWRNPRDPATINAKNIMVPDFVNPASGASTAAFLLAAKEKGGVPAQVDHVAIAATRQGIRFNQAAMADLGIISTYVALFECDEMNRQYYLTGRPVGDAGHILRHFLPRV